MRYKKESDRLYFFITISIVIHLLIFLLFPYGNYSVMGTEGEVREFSYIQMVEYKAESTQVDSQVNIEAEETVDEVNDEIIEEPEEELIEEIEDVSDQIDDLDLNNHHLEEDVSEEVIEHEVPESEETVEIDEIIEESPVDDIVEESTPNDDINLDSKDILTAEGSDIELAIDESSSEENNESSKDIKKEPKEEKTPPPPPPPPTLGELNIGAPEPPYPKYLEAQGISGQVVLHVRVSSSGEIEYVNVQNSSGYEEMDRNARMRIERDWQFTNYQSSYSFEVIVSYEIDDEGNPTVSVTRDNLTF
ncbi:energy transducer TonB [Natronospora cellulosivora (SeqCode)]